ncbi:hypothetical protein MIMGU_mgv11b018110mg [Erythranthe guttata]|uniref:EF-hand domain-containing protein n=1 Tax=Erythranthe guttata TaxID=4155 RepID=A0A022RER3_ERYGU|nr:hypothetical protein MIMGU_mgv11b018110mg [Erythranthe guttata]
MADIHKIAKAYYARATEEEREKAKNYFRSLDANCDGKISFAEYKTMVSRRCANDTMFNAIDKNGDGSLDIEEVLALYFILMKCPLRSCNACGSSISGAYFSYLPCEKNDPNTYELCCSCYGGGKFEHHHLAAKKFEKVDAGIQRQKKI